MESKLSILLPAQQKLTHVIWAAIFLLILLDAGWAHFASIGFDFSRAMIFFYVVAGCIGLSQFYKHVRRDDTVWLIGHVTAQIICATAALGVLSYLSAGLNFPLHDEQLIKLDAMLGFDWREHMAFVNRNPWLADIFTLAYFTSGPQIMIILGLMFMFRQSQHIQRFIVAFMLTALLTIFFAATFAAFGGYVHYNIDVATQLPNLHPAAARVHELPMMGMRNGTTHILAFPLEGIVTFPSFHSALAMVMTYACWPVKKLFWPVAALNVVVLLSTPTNGGHYLFDIFGGVACAAIAIWLAQRIRFT
jgi:membrane-associated phospholipid phosphatase